MTDPLVLSGRSRVCNEKKGPKLGESNFIFAPPLIISRDQIDDAVNVLNAALYIADQQIEV